MNKFMHLFLLAVLLTFILHNQKALAGKSASDASNYDDTEWITMPAGGRPAYMGIHGGTMPVSLLVSGDGNALLTFVGRTGNDFLEALRATDLPLPSFLNGTQPKSGNLPQSDLFAGNATKSLPVIALSGDNLAKLLSPEKLQPFGLSDEPLSIEGEVERPTFTPQVRNKLSLFLPAYFQPRR